jgi:hypothetical protein
MKTIAAKMTVTTKTRLQNFSANWKRSNVSGPRSASKRSEQAFPVPQSTMLTRGAQEREKAAEEEAAREHDIALGNPLLNPKSDFNVKRRYVVHGISHRSSR